MHLTPAGFTLLCTSVCLHRNHKMSENVKFCQGTGRISILVSVRIWEMLFKYYGFLVAGLVWKLSSWI